MGTLETYEAPRSFTPNNVMYWCPETKQVKGSVKLKALKFVKLGLVKEVSGIYYISPIEGYNKTTYQVNGGCNCQGFKKNQYCSHMLAVAYFNKLNETSN